MKYGGSFSSVRGFSGTTSHPSSVLGSIPNAKHILISVCSVMLTKCPRSILLIKEDDICVRKDSSFWDHRYRRRQKIIDSLRFSNILFDSADNSFNPFCQSIQVSIVQFIRKFHDKILRKDLTGYFGRYTISQEVVIMEEHNNGFKSEKGKVGKPPEHKDKLRALRQKYRKVKKEWNKKRDKELRVIEREIVKEIRRYA